MAYLGTRLKMLFAYRFEIFVWLFGPLLQMVLLATVWNAVYSGRSSVDGVSITVMTTYVTMSTIHGFITHDDMDEWVHERVDTGAIGMDLLRPIPFVEQALWGSVAQLVMKLPMIAVTLPVGALLSGLAPPAAPGTYLLSALLAWLVNLCVYLVLSSFVFWTVQVGGVNFLYYVVSGFLSGALVPLWFMPDWLAAALSWLPFQATVYTPASIYVGQLSGSDAWQAIGVQALWLLPLGAGASLLWRKAIRRTVVQGG